nr:hypothetical protein [Tanacetum cinerariifolium]
MSTRSSARNLFSPLDNPELTIRKRSGANPTLLNDFEMTTDENDDPPVPDLQTMEELCQPTFNGRGGPIASIAIQATNFRLKNDMIQQVQNSCQFHGLPGDDANKHLDKFLHVTQSIKVNGVTDDTFRGTFMKRRPEECCDLIENMTAHHNDWDTSAQRSESSSSITSSSDLKIVALKAKMAEINKNLMKSPLAKPRTYMLWEPIKVVTLTNLKMNTASSSGSRTLPSNTITNPKEDLKGITTRSGNSYQGPTIPTTFSSLPQVVERETEVTKDTVPSTNNESTKDVQPLIVQVETPIPNFKPVVAPVSAPKPYLKLSIPYPSRLHDQKLHLDASINLMPLSVWNKLSLPELTPTLMTLELANWSISRLIGVAKDVFVKVGKFHFPADFVVVDFDADPRVPLILRRSFLKTRKALIDVYEGELTLRVGKEAITFNLDQTLRYSANYNDMTANRIDVIDMACEEYSQEVLSFSNVIMSSNPTPYYDPIIFTSSPTLTPFGDSDFLLEEVDAFLALEDDPTSLGVYHSYYDMERDILLLEAFLNDDLSLPLPTQGMYLPQIQKELKICEAKNDKYSIDEPPEVKLKDLPPHLEYTFLEGEDKFPVIIAKDLSVEEKAALIKIKKRPHLRVLTERLPTVQRCKMAIFYDMIEKTMEVFMDDFSVFGNSFGTCLSYLEKMLKRCEDTSLCLNWEKSHFMVKEGIVLGHKISKNGIEVDKAKVDVIAKLPHPTTVKGIRSFLGHSGFYRRFIQDFLKIAWPMTRLLEKDTLFFFSNECAVLGQQKTKHFQPIHYASKTMTDAQAHYTTTEKELLAVVHAFEKFRPYLILSKSIVYTDHSALKYLFNKQDAKPRLLRWVLLLQEFDITVCDKKGAENLAADHISRLENPHQSVLDNKEINETFPLETLNMVSFRGDLSTTWFSDFANYHAGNFVVKGMSSQQKNRFFKDVKHYFWDGPFLFKICIDFMGPFSSSRGNKYILMAVDYLSKWVEAKALPTNDARVICKFLKSLFARFGTPRAIISDRGTHFCNDQFAKVMLKYGVTRRLATAYHPQTSGQVEVSNHGLKRILKRIVGDNHASWSDKLDDALWAFRTAFKTPIGCTPYKLTAGDHRKVQLNELNELRDQAYENSLIYKEKPKRLHDSKIKDHVFNISDRVLLFNSRLKIFLGKLKTRWSGPFTITQVFPYGTVELSQTDGPNFKVNGQRLKHYFG